MSISFILLFLLVLLAIKSGLQTLSWDQVFNSYNKSSDIFEVFVHNKFLSVMGILLVSFSLSVSGLVTQTISRNSLAEPSLMGISAAAKLGVTVISVSPSLLAAPLFGKFALVFIFAFIPAVVIVAAIVMKKGLMSPLTIVFIGISLSMVLVSVEWMTKFRNENSSLFINGFLGNGFQVVSEERLLFMMPFLIIPVLVIYCFSKRLNLLNVGKKFSDSLGGNSNSTRVVTLLMVLLIVPASIMIGGELAFVGLFGPHIARTLFRTSDNRVLIPASGIIASIIVLIAYIVSSYYPNLHINSIMIIIAAPVFIYFARKI